MEQDAKTIEEALDVLRSYSSEKIEIITALQCYLHKQTIFDVISIPHFEFSLYPPHLGLK